MIAELNESNRPQFLAAVRGRPYFGVSCPVHLAVFGRSGALMRFYVADGSAAVQLKGRSAVLCGTYDAEETGAFLRMQGVRYVNAGGAAPAGYSPLYALHNLVLGESRRSAVPGRCPPDAGPRARARRGDGFYDARRGRPRRVGQFLFRALHKAGPGRGRGVGRAAGGRARFYGGRLRPFAGYRISGRR